MELQKMSQGQIETKLDKNWTKIGKKHCFASMLASSLPHIKIAF